MLILHKKDAWADADLTSRDPTIAYTKYVEAFLFLGMFLLAVDGRLSELRLPLAYNLGCSLHELRRPTADFSWGDFPVTTYAYVYTQRRRRPIRFTSRKEFFFMLVQLNISQAPCRIVLESLILIGTIQK